MVWTAAFTFLAAFFSAAPQRPKTMGNDMMQAARGCRPVRWVGGTVLVLSSETYWPCGRDWWHCS